MLAMKTVAVSSGAGCSAADLELSHVLKSIGLNYAEARSTLRLRPGRFATEISSDRCGPSDRNGNGFEGIESLVGTGRLRVVSLITTAFGSVL